MASIPKGHWAGVFPAATTQFTTDLAVDFEARNACSIGWRAKVSTGSSAWAL